MTPVLHASGFTTKRNESVSWDKQRVLRLSRLISVSFGLSFISLLDVSFLPSGFSTNSANAFPLLWIDLIYSLLLFTSYLVNIAAQTITARSLQRVWINKFPSRTYSSTLFHYSSLLWSNFQFCFAIIRTMPRFILHR